MKVGSKRRRTRQEIIDDVAAEQAKLARIEQHLGERENEGVDQTG